MAISEKIFKKFTSYVNKSNSILELGDQEFTNECMNYFNLKESVRIVKKFCESLNKTHISIDITGRNGSLPLDLNKETLEISSTFDLITNFGTTEHIEPNQYYPFKHIHNLCKINGLMIHEIPVIGHWPGHCRFYYDEKFFEVLAKENDYDIIEMNRINYEKVGDLLFVCLKKKQKDFRIDKNLFLSLIKTSNIPVNIPEYWK